MTTTSSRSKKKRSSRSRSRRGARSGNLFVWIFLVVLVVAFAIIAFISRSNRSSTSGDPNADVEITPAQVAGQTLQQFGQEPDPAVGQPAPRLTGTSIDGEPMTIEPGDGTPKAIAFLAHWCPHCQREVPTVVSWAEDAGVPEGVEVLGVATGIDPNQPNYPPHTWFERESWTFPTLVDGDAAANRAYGLSSYPFWVLIDGEGNVVQRWAGETTPEQLTERIGQLAQGGAS
jgi:cytochrome c biogenesis protein CcmG/thiol:disulfide interchange protein DsbE